MNEWQRVSPLQNLPNKSKEIWIRNTNDKDERFNVEIFFGKKTDLLALKKSIVDTLSEKIAYYQKSRTELYGAPNREPVTACPVCDHTSADAVSQVTIYGAEYVQCQSCSHVYVKERPAQKTIYDFYLNDVTYAATYTDKPSAERRMNSIAVPWVEWMTKVYEKQYGTKPKKILDIGSGAGHFVEACRRAGYQADGIELNESSRQFASEVWGIEMDGRNFIEVAKEYDGYDVVTCWGLLEHTPNPGKILGAAQQVFQSTKNPMVIAKVPRWDALSSAIQRLSNDTIIRHLDPMGHIMAFTDASIAELYYRSGFKPTAAWYYGMDVYETFMQVGNQIKQYDHFTNTGELQMELQQFVDEQHFADGITLVGIPK